MEKKLMIEHILYELMMEAIEAHPQAIEEMTTSDYQGFMGAKAMNAAHRILELK
jgi:hypothetical protein